MEQKTTLIKIGDFFFKYRNYLFPLLLVTLFLSSPPPSEYFGYEWLEDVVDVLAFALVLAGLALRGAVIGYRYIKRGGINKKVYAENLVTDGFFGVCRNPLYVGNFLVVTGILAKHGSMLVFPLGLAFFTFVYIAIVAAEEYFLRNEFGEAYTAYCKDVPRWWMKWSRLKGATEGMQFNFKRALLKDYSTITNTMVALLVLELWEQMNANPALHEQVEWLELGSMLGFVALMALGIRIAKKRKLLVAG